MRWTSAEAAVAVSRGSSGRQQRQQRPSAEAAAAVSRSSSSGVEQRGQRDGGTRKTGRQTPVKNQLHAVHKTRLCGTRGWERPRGAHLCRNQLRAADDRGFAARERQCRRAPAAAGASAGSTAARACAGRRERTAGSCRRCQASRLGCRLERGGTQQGVGSVGVWRRTQRSVEVRSCGQTSSIVRHAEVWGAASTQQGCGEVGKHAERAFPEEMTRRGEGSPGREGWGSLPCASGRLHDRRFVEGVDTA
eukprot:361560-Chlamydomonas_euryale.AAC.2